MLGIFKSRFLKKCGTPTKQEVKLEKLVTKIVKPKSRTQQIQLSYIF